MVCLDPAALNSRDGPDFAPQLCYTRHSREAGSCIHHYRRLRATIAALAERLGRQTPHTRPFPPVGLVPESGHI